MVSLISPAHLPPSFDAYADYPMASSSSTSFYPPPPGDDNFPPTQEASQSQTSYISPDFTSWAILDPFDQSMPQLDFGIPYPIIQIGRRPPPYNMFCLEGLKISAIHCKIEWDGFGGYKLQDLSHNGTFVNDVRVPKGQWRVIRNGDILAFGSRHLYKYVFKATNLDGINDPRFKYEIIQSIGSGSFGDVYKALVRETGTYVAIKHIRLAKKSYDASLVKRELVMLETFKHPNIVKFHHAYACTGDGIPGAGVRLVLEYVDGLDIANWSADRHVIDEAMYQHFFHQICEAMGYLHTLNVAHRDLKLENVLLTSHDPPIIKIADFGLAKVVDSRLTHFKTNCGTPITMAPEQCSASTYTTIVDSWAVGTMLYMLVCNELPIWGRRGNPHWYRNAARWKADLGEVLETFNATPISSAAKSFINCLLQWDPDHRAPLLSMLDEEWMQEYLPPVYDFTSDPPVKQRDLRRAHSNVRPPFPRPGGNRALPSSRVPPSPEQTGTGTVMPDTAPGADLHLYVPTVRDTSGSSGSIPGLGH